MASQGEVPRRLGGNPSSEVTVQSQNKAKHTASQEDFPGKLLGNPNSEALAYNQDKASEAEGTAEMLREYSLPTPSKVGFFDRSKAVIICGLAESNSIIPSERIHNDLHQFTETGRTVFKISLEIREQKAYRMGSTYCNNVGEQRPCPLKAILENKHRN